MQNLKLLVVGDGGVGKSCLLISYTTNSFPSEYVPTVFDNYCANIMFEGKPISMGLWDTAGQEDYDRLRPLSYPGTDIMLICFDISNRSSFENIQSRWMPEVNHHIPNVPKLLVGCKRDLRSSTTHADRLVSVEEANSLAKNLHMQYCETSALTMDGLKFCFDTAVRTALAGIKHTKHTKKKMFGAGLFGAGSKKEEPLLLPPIMPPTGKAPLLGVETAVFAEQWRTFLKNPTHEDVIFLMDSTKELKAHKIMLCSASEFFCRLFHEVTEPKNQLAAVKSRPFSTEDVNSGSVPGLASIYTRSASSSEQDVTVVQLAQDVCATAFSHVLEFLYTGIPGLPDDPAKDLLNEVKRLSELFDLSHLKTICENIEKDQDFLNPSIGTYLNDQTGGRLKDMYMNKSQSADVIFVVDGEKIYGHKAVVSARCEVLAAMFSCYFSEGQAGVSSVEVPGISAQTFLALLEYLYTDHAPIEEGESVEILVIADQYCQSRLVSLCELYITLEVDRAVTKQIQKSQVDVIGLLLTAQRVNAKQLASWCLHFISSNYQAFKLREEFPLLQDENLNYIEEHQWPPETYLNEVREYEQKLKQGKDAGKCVVM